MSRHSKNSTSQSIFTYGEKKKLKGEYGTKEQRIGQDSIKTFDMCTICNNRVIEPVCCEKGHMFCRSCAIEYLVKQKKKIAENNELVDRQQNQKKEKEALLKVEENMKKIIDFEKYDNFEEIAKRRDISQEENSNEEVVNSKMIKPTGMYEITSEKDKYLKSSFWTMENTPAVEQKHERSDASVKCPGGDHKLTLKKLRRIIVKDIDGQFCCGICNKEIGRQKIGSYKCGHAICLACKSTKCELCDKKDGWIDIQSSSSSFASHNHSEVKTYTHAFYM